MARRCGHDKTSNGFGLPVLEATLQRGYRD
jgi:hypothetical protein